MSDGHRSGRSTDIIIIIIIIIIINGEAPIVLATARRPSLAMVSAMRPAFLSYRQKFRRYSSH